MTQQTEGKVLITKKIEPNLSDGWDEYADYSWNGTHLGSYWLEMNESSNQLNGVLTTQREGQRYLLNTTQDGTKLDENGEPYSFYQWSCTSKEPNEHLKIQAVTWSHYHLDDALFDSNNANITVAETSHNQSVIYSVQYEHDLWLEWTYSEFNTANIVDLSEKIELQLLNNGNDYAEVDITQYSSNAQQNVTITDSFYQDAEGNERTWYIVTNAFEGELKLYETGLPNLYDNWQLAIVPGGMQIYVPDGYRFADGSEMSLIPMPPLSDFDTQAGRFNFELGFAYEPSLPFHLFLNKADAQAELYKLKR